MRSVRDITLQNCAPSRITIPTSTSGAAFIINSCVTNRFLPMRRMHHTPAHSCLHSSASARPCSSCKAAGTQSLATCVAEQAAWHPAALCQGQASFSGQQHKHSGGSAWNISAVHALGTDSAACPHPPEASMQHSCRSTGSRCCPGGACLVCWCSAESCTASWETAQSGTKPSFLAASASAPAALLTALSALRCCLQYVLKRPAA